VWEQSKSQTNFIHHPYAHHPKRRRAQLVGTATLRMKDLCEMLPMMTKRLRIEDLLIEAETAAGKSKKRKAASA
jgi:hypothetical protein